MTEAGQRRRRLLLAGLGLGGVAMLATPAWLRRRIARHAGEDCANADWVFRNSESAREIGRRYLAEVPHEAELEALESALATSLGTDPVAVDTVGYEFILKERMKRGVQQLEDKNGRAFLQIAEELGLGYHRSDKIDLHELKG